MPYPMLILLFFAFLTASTVFSMLGQGGGAFYVPMLLAVSVPFYVAATTSQVLIIVVSVSSMLIFARARMLDWKLVLLIEPPTNLGSFLGGFFSDYIPPFAAKLCFAGILLAGSYFMYRPARERSRIENGGRWWHWQRTGVAEPYRVHVLVLVPVMIASGFAAGLLGVGGGLIKVPVVVLLGGVPMSSAVGSSPLMVGVTALTGFIGHILKGHFDLKLAVPLAAGVLIGSQIGPRFSVRTDKARLKKYFAFILAGIALWLVYDVLR